MKYVRINDVDGGAKRIATTLASHLQLGETVTWILAGGSALTLEVAIAHHLTQQGVDTQKLRIIFGDERYGTPGHADENWQQLMNLGFSLAGAQVYRTLDGADIETTTDYFGTRLVEWLETSDYSFGIFGIGTDGHTSGIKPHSPATGATTPVIHYKWDDFPRITMTPGVIAELDEVVLWAMGDEKQAAIEALMNGHASIDDMPAQILKNVKNSSLYTNVMYRRFI